MAIIGIDGIDPGTSNSAAAVLRGGRPVIIPSAEGISLGAKAFPSHVAITADGQMTAQQTQAPTETGAAKPVSPEEAESKRVINAEYTRAEEKSENCERLRRRRRTRRPREVSHGERADC